MCDAPYDQLQGGVSSGTSYVMPEAGRITSWSTNAATGGGQTYEMKVFRLVSGQTYSVVGHDGPRPLNPSGLSTFGSNVSVKAGDLLGIHVSAASVSCVQDTGDNGDLRLSRQGDLADGQSGLFGKTPTQRMNIAAVLEPTNTFSVEAIKRNKKRGTARLTIKLPNPGDLALSGGGAKPVTDVVPQPGTASLLVKPKGKKKRTLSKSGKVKVRPTITFTPTAGKPHGESLKLKLIKRV